MGDGDSAAHLSKQDGVSKDDVEDNARGDNEHTLPHWPVSQQVGVVLGDLAVGVVIGECHEAAQRDGPQTVLHCPSLHTVHTCDECPWTTSNAT